MRKEKAHNSNNSDTKSPEYYLDLSKVPFRNRFGVQIMFQMRHPELLDPSDREAGLPPGAGSSTNGGNK
jgi:hypothetical protein